MKTRNPKSETRIKTETRSASVRFARARFLFWKSNAEAAKVHAEVAEMIWISS